MKQLFVIDAMGFIFRSYHAIGRMTNPQGASTNALFGFVRSILKLQKDFSPTHLVVVFDGHENDRSRKALYPEYKAHRGDTPLDLLPQFSWAEEFCRLKGIHTLSLEGVEADDTMASIAKWAEPEGIQTYLCSSDKDLAQAVTHQTFILNVFKDNLVLDPVGVEKTYGLPPERIGDYLALLGDASDNIPGVPGIGPKGATELLATYGSLEGIHTHLADIKGKRGEAIRNNLDSMIVSRKLVTLETDLPVPKDYSFYEIQEPNTEELKSLFQTHGFNSLLQEIGQKKRLERKEGAIVRTEDELKELVELLSKADKIAVHLETTSESPLRAEAVGIGLGTSPEEIWYIPFNGLFSKETALKHLKPLLESKPLLGHHFKYELHILHGLGVRPLPPVFDTMVASYLLNAEERQHSLDALSLKAFDHAKIPRESLLGKGKDLITVADVPIEKVAAFSSEEVEMTLRLQEVFQKELKERDLLELFETVELPLIPVLREMEAHGIFIDKEFLKSFGERVAEAAHRLEEAIFAFAGERFNINSPKQLSEILFEKLQIHPPKKTKTGYSTNAEVLEILEDKHPMIPLILEYRTLEKLRSTYIDSLPLEINSRTGRVHCTFNQSVAATGRLSCQDPNLQNIPIRSPLGHEIRAAFRPETEEWLYLAADYSQIELRLLAHFSQDPLLIEAFTSGGDVHKRTASTLFNVPLEEVTGDMRSKAKAVNFGIIYGQQAFGLSRELGIDPKEADRFIHLYFEKYGKVKEYLDKSKLEARKTGFARTIAGRERRIPDLQNPNANIRAAAERLAVNTPLQGSQADLIKKAMIAIDDRMKKEGLKALLLLQIHDELLFEVPKEEVDRLSSLVKEEMEGVFSLSVPLTVDLNIGKNWKDC